MVPDTNLWRYIVDADATESVRLAAKRASVKVVACPAVVYECLRVGDARLRRRLADALTRNDWARPMPEVFVEAEAVRSEIARLHPEWLNPRPQLENYWRNREDWRGGFWSRVRSEPEVMAEVVTRVQGDSVEKARLQAATARTEAQQTGHSERSLRLDTASARYERPVPGWDGEPFQTWRLYSQNHWWEAVVMGQHETATDWLAPWLDLRRVRGEPDVWVRMWTREVDSKRLPREWIRWGMREVQALKKVTPGTPVDNQIATYLVDYDVFLTSDRGFGQCIEWLRPYAPSPLALVEVAPGGPGAVEYMLDLFTRVSNSSPLP